MLHWTARSVGENLYTALSAWQGTIIPHNYNSVSRLRVLRTVVGIYTGKRVAFIQYFTRPHVVFFPVR